jgi:hypothetical protein
VYILKKNVQRQEGNLITNDPQTILDGGKQDYVVAQRLLTDPMLVGGRKVNMRVYLLVTIPPGAQSALFFIYDNGFMYYTPKYWNPSSAASQDPDVHITTGYIDRQVYAENPLTFRDLEGHIGREQYAKLWLNITGVMSTVRQTYEHRLAQQNAAHPGTKFLIYGCDMAPDSSLEVKPIEINKGPDLSYKDERDRQVKFDMTRDAFELVGAVGPKTHTSFGRFVQV